MKSNRNILQTHDAHESSHIAHPMGNLLCFIYVKCQKDGHLEVFGQHTHTHTHYIHSDCIGVLLIFEAAEGSVVCDHTHVLLAADVKN